MIPEHRSYIPFNEINITRIAGQLLSVLPLPASPPGSAYFVNVQTVINLALQPLLLEQISQY